MVHFLSMYKADRSSHSVIAEHHVGSHQLACVLHVHRDSERKEGSPGQSNADNLVALASPVVGNECQRKKLCCLLLFRHELCQLSVGRVTPTVPAKASIKNCEARMVAGGR